jgi:hypothetical protein
LIPAAGCRFRSGFRKIKGIFSEYLTIGSTVNRWALRFQKSTKEEFYNPNSNIFWKYFTLLRYYLLNVYEIISI